MAKLIALVAVPAVLAAAILSATGAFAKAPAQKTAGTTAAELENETTDAAGGHADNPNDPNADHQFEGEE